MHKKVESRESSRVSSVYVFGMWHSIADHRMGENRGCCWGQGHTDASCRDMCWLQLQTYNPIVSLLQIELNQSA